MKSKRHYFVLIMSIVSFSLLLAGGTYAWLIFGSTVGSNTQELEATCFSMNYSGGFTTLVGDLNFDGNLNSSDEVIFLNRSFYETYPENKDLDFNGDGLIGTEDYQILTDFLLGNTPVETLPLFPSKTDKGGLIGTLTLSIKEECNVSANGYVHMNIGASTSNKYFMNKSLRYSLYESDKTTLISSGYLSTYGVNNLNPSDPIPLTKTDTTYYVYVWLDGTKVDNSYLNLPFSATMYASAVQIES